VNDRKPPGRGISALPQQRIRVSAVVLTSFEGYVACMEREGVIWDARFRF
jgi:hypothetical protein